MGSWEESNQKKYICKINLKAKRKIFLLAVATFSFFIKTPVYFFNIWLLKAHVESPTQCHKKNNTKVGSTVKLWGPLKASGTRQ